MKWFYFDQNNSGGYFIQNDQVGHGFFVQAETAREADTKAEKIVEDYSDYCECCGERWYINSRDEKGYDAPEIYGTPLSEMAKDFGQERYVLHYADGRVEEVILPAGQ